MASRIALAGIALLVLGGVTGPAQAEGPTLNIVGDGIPASLTGAPGDPEAGKKVLINRKQGNCLACHVVSALSDQPFHGEVGPPLDGAGDRWEEAQLRLIVADSKRVFEGTIMPAFHRTDGLSRVAKKFKGKTILSAAQVEDVVAYLKTLKE